MTIAATVVCDRQLSATTFDVLGRDEARKSATAYIFITLAGIVKNLQTLTSQYFNKDYDNGTKQKRTEYK